MKPSKTKLELIEPKILNESDGIEAWFTRKNFVSKNVQKIQGLNLGFNTKEDEGVVTSNRSKLLSQLGIDPDKIAYADQVHSNQVQIITESGIYGETDALITQISGLALAIQVADCAAVLLADEHANIIAAVHAGWRGAAGDIFPKTMMEMLALGASAKDIKAFVSPCISQENFEVGIEVAERFPKQFVDYKSYKKPHIDLRGFLRYQMLDFGIHEQHIEIHSGCTVSDEHQYYSYRREQEQSGRMLAVIRNRE